MWIRRTSDKCRSEGTLQACQFRLSIHARTFRSVSLSVPSLAYLTPLDYTSNIISKYIMKMYAGGKKSIIQGIF
jgi:hypothetical protein